MAATDPFLSAYLAGTPVEVPERRGRAARGPAMASASETVALHGCVLSPEGPREDTWLVIQGGRIDRLAARKPAGVTSVRTDGVILPGLIDLHGHPEFNVFAPWEPPRSYPNRYSWRGSKAYQDLIRTPQNLLQTRLPKGTQLRYAEIRALVGGVTAIQGASGLNRATDESLVRNVDLRIFGQHRARAAIDLPDGPNGRGADTLANILTAISNGEVDAFYVHLAEGQRVNQRSIDEFTNLTALGALTPATVVIHGTALTRDQLGNLRDGGASLVWSPQSNLRLYGQTTRAADALDLGLPLALGADWLTA
jgi:cytosine/adenosine deaminase-related metal-dependent hydrolase